MDRKTRVAIGVDLGGTKIDFGLVDETGQIHDHVRIQTPIEKGAEGIENLMIENIKKLQEKASFPLLGIGIGVAGQINRETGEVIFAPNLKWNHVPLRAKLEEALKLPVRVINDARALTLGEWQYGAGIGLQDLLCLFIGTGIGGGIVSGGSLQCGASNAFGEVGHMTIDYRGPVCTCGKKGCFEAFCGGWGIVARAKDEIGQNNATKILELAGGDMKNVTAFHVVEAFREKDPLAQTVITQMTDALVPACASLINILNPRRLILGGGVVEAMPELIEIIDQGVKKMALKAATSSLEVVRAKLGKELGVLGSATVIFNLLKGSD